jgi:hypothetical protein
MMTDRASDRGSGDCVMSCQVANYGARRGAGKASSLCATDKPDTNDQRND